MVFSGHTDVHGGSIFSKSRAREDVIDGFSHASGGSVIGVEEEEFDGFVADELGSDFAFDQGPAADHADCGVIFLDGGAAGSAFTAEKPADGDGALSDGVD